MTSKLTCQETRDLIHGYIDGELDLIRNLDIEHHLAECTGCTQVYRNQQALRTAVRSSNLYYNAPASLRQRVQSSVRRVERPAFPISPLGVASGFSSRVALGIAAVLVVVLVAVWSIARSTTTTPSDADFLVQEIIASHVRSLMVNHLSDVVSSDQHTVKPWFDGKLDFSPWVEDLANQGFPLIGGRLDYMDNRTVAALIYERKPHFINLFVWPSPHDPNTDLQELTRQGYQLFHWTEGGMTYWAISDLNPSELLQFAQLVQHHASLSTTP